MKTVIILRAPAGFKEDLKDFCKKEGLTMSSVIRQTMLRIIEDARTKPNKDTGSAILSS